MGLGTVTATTPTPPAPLYLPDLRNGALGAVRSGDPQVAAGAVQPLDVDFLVGPSGKLTNAHSEQLVAGVRGLVGTVVLESLDPRGLVPGDSEPRPVKAHGEEV